jgi:Phosphotransferase enzyme family
VAEELTTRAISVAVAVARRHGVEVRDPRVLSDRSNLIVELAPAPVVARVATSTADVRPGGARGWLARDVALAAHLAAAGADVVRPATTPPAGPHMEEGLAMAFWEKVMHDRSRPPAPREAGEALGRLHEALEDFPGDLPPFSALLDECDAVIERLRLSQTDVLRFALHDIRAAIDAAALPERPVHGDASRSNLLRTPAGLLWTDFEDTCAGPVEWDLACLALSAAPDGDEALGAYGRPLDDALEPFMEARRLQGALWTALLAVRHPELRERAEERLSRWAPTA